MGGARYKDATVDAVIAVYLKNWNRVIKRTPFRPAFEYQISIWAVYAMIGKSGVFDGKPGRLGRRLEYGCQEAEEV